MHAQKVVTIGPEDALIVVDMQNDFVPTDDVNPSGGAFGVAEGGHVAGLIVDLMERFGACGGVVVATRDYHPNDHCSFIPHGGPFPPHCIQGSAGPKFYKPIGECLKRLQALGRTGDVVFKGYHEDIDSFGSFTYPSTVATDGRVVCRPDGPAGLHDCTLHSWTGAIKLKCSNCEEDVDAPPDILSCHRRQTLENMLKEKGIKRVFACGLALDFCVLDTALNGKGAGFPETFLILDAARAAHLPGIGTVGSGFLQDLGDLKQKLAGGKVQLVPTAALLPQLQVKNPLSFQEVGRVFPDGLGPFALTPAAELRLQLDAQGGKFTVQAPEAEINSLKRYNVDPTGSMGPLAPITLDDGARMALQIPKSATQFAWGYPLGKGSFDEKAHGYFSITTPAAAFCVYGGFVYVDGQGDVAAVMAVSVGSGLTFGTANKWKAKYSAGLEGRWQPVTAPLLRKKGAKLFAWINPGEVLKAGGQDPWAVCKHGAFVYLFHDDVSAEDERDVYFQVQDKAEPMKLSLGRISHRDMSPLMKGEPNPEPSPMQNPEPQPEMSPVPLKEVKKDKCCVIA